MTGDNITRPQQDSERDLVRRARRGDDRAFELLVERLAPALYKVVRRVSSDDLETEAIVQETFLRLWRRLGSLAEARPDEVRPLLPFLVTIALNLGRDQWRRSRFVDFSGLAAVEESLAAADLAPEEQVEQSELLERLAGAVAALPPAYRAVIAMRYDAGMSYQEIAGALDLPLNTVRTHIHRAKMTLRQALHLEDATNG
jgi:RNA polymerase sigma-70 factor (ECF subfamily)